MVFDKGDRVRFLSSDPVYKEEYGIVIGEGIGQQIKLQLDSGSETYVFRKDLYKTFKIGDYVEVCDSGCVQYQKIGIIKNRMSGYLDAWEVEIDGLINQFMFWNLVFISPPEKETIFRIGTWPIKRRHPWTSSRKAIGSVLRKRQTHIGESTRLLLLKPTTSLTFVTE